MSEKLLPELLRQQAAEIAAAGHNGWGNTMLQAADAIEQNTRAGGEAVSGSLDDLMRQVAEQFPLAAIVHAIDKAAPGFKTLMPKPELATKPAAGSGEAVPAGWVLVPREPTLEMGQAIAQAVFDGDIAIWRAALDAAPVPAGSEVK